MWLTPALLTRMSRCWSNASSAASAMALTLSAELTSTICTSACGPRSAASVPAASALRSAIITRAPSAMNLRTMPAPKPEAPPVTIAVLPLSLIGSPVPCRHRLQHREAAQRLHALFAAVPGFADAAEGKLDAAAGAVIVDEDLPRADGFGKPHLPPPVGGPDAGDETVAGAV